MQLKADADFTAFRARLAELEGRLSDLRPVMDDLGEDLRELIREGFDTEGASYGKRWAPLAPAYRKHRISKDRGSDILNLRGGGGGRLLKSFQGRNSWKVYTLRRDGVQVGTKLGIAGPHDRGFSRTLRLQRKDGSTYSRSYRIPKRPLLPPARLVADRYGNQIAEFVTTGERRRGL